MENFPSFILLFNVSAATYPRLASAFGAVWVLGKIVYCIAYSTKGPSGRRRGAYISTFGLVVLVCSDYCRFSKESFLLGHLDYTISTWLGRSVDEWARSISNEWIFICYIRYGDNKIIA